MKNDVLKDYVKLEDFAAELNERYDLGIDIARVASCQDSHDEKEEMFRMCKIDRGLKNLERTVLEMLRNFWIKNLIRNQSIIKQKAGWVEWLEKGCLVYQ